MEERAVTETKEWAINQTINPEAEQAKNQQFKNLLTFDLMPKVTISRVALQTALDEALCWYDECRGGLTLSEVQTDPEWAWAKEIMDVLGLDHHKSLIDK